MRLTYFLPFLFFTIRISAQITEVKKEYPAGYPGRKSDLQLEALQVENINKIYYKLVATPKDLINGKECLPYSFRGNTTAYLFTRDKLNSTLIANNRQYNNIKLQYDTFKDDLVYVDTSRIINFEFPRIALNKEIIEGFSFYYKGGFYNFIYLRFQEGADRLLTDGFYEVVYEGSIRFIIKHTSTFYSKEGLSEYKYSPLRFMSSGGRFFQVRNKKDLIKLLNDHPKEIKDFLRKERIKVKKAEKDEIVRVIKYYDSLKGSAKLPG